MQRPSVNPVSSSQISGIGTFNHDAKAGHVDLAVEFSRGGLYSYSSVPAAVVSELLAAESIGSHFGAHVKAQYSVRKWNEASQEFEPLQRQPASVKQREFLRSLMAREHLIDGEPGERMGSSTYAVLRAFLSDADALVVVNDRPLVDEWIAGIFSDDCSKAIEYMKAG